MFHVFTQEPVTCLLATSINGIFDALIDFSLSEPTHITSDSGVMSHIDRFALGSSSWNLSLFNFESHVFARASTLNTLHLSDHALVGIKVVT